MTNLMSAHCLRLRKSVLFWFALGFSAAFAVFRLYTLLKERSDYGTVIILDEALFTYTVLIGLVTAVFTSLFLGTEYSDGALRNKITAGCSRLAIYLSCLVTSIAVSVLCMGVYLLAVIFPGVALIGFWTLEIKMLLLLLLGILLMTAAFCAIFTLIAMNCPHKAASAVACILLFFALMIASTYVAARLDAQEEFVTYSLIDGEMVSSMEPNPRYLQGTEREVYEFIFDLLPTGQASQYAAQYAVHLWRMPVCSFAIIVVTSGVGMALFKRKDLK